MGVPELAKELHRLEEENQRLQCEIEKFENPLHLMTLARKAEFAHLKHPTLLDIITVTPCTEEPCQPLQIKND